MTRRGFPGGCFGALNYKRPVGALLEMGAIYQSAFFCSALFVVLVCLLMLYVFTSLATASFLGRVYAV